MRTSAPSRPVLFVTAALAGLALAATARAESPEELLHKVDQTIGGNADQVVRMRMTTSERGKEDRVLIFSVTVKGQLRRIEFLAPGDVKGTRILVLSPSQMYIYLPAYKKVRRIATHMKEQGFMGSAWDHDEFSLAVFGVLFSAKTITDKGAYWSMELARRPDQEFTYAKLEVDVRKDNHQPIEIRYFNDKGAVAKTEQRLDFVCQQGFCTPKRVIMTDHTRNDVSTRMDLEDWKANQGVPESFFTVRALQRGT